MAFGWLPTEMSLPTQIAVHKNQTEVQRECCQLSNPTSNGVVNRGLSELILSKR
jgi:hypothetical protein